MTADWDCYKSPQQLIETAKLATAPINKELAKEFENYLSLPLSGLASFDRLVRVFEFMVT